MIQLLPEKKICIVSRTSEQIYFRNDLVNLWNRGYRGILLDSMGFDHFPVRHAKEIGFIVKNLPDYCSGEVAEHGFTMLSRLMERLEENRSLRDFSVLVIGSEGHIGKKLVYKSVGRCKEVLMFDKKLGHDKKRLDSYWGKVDVVFLAIPLNPGTKSFVDYYLIKKGVKNRPYLVNVSGRKKLVQINDLRIGLNRGLLKGYCIDEELNANMLKKPNLLWTPHIGWKSDSSVIKRKVVREKTLKELEKELEESKKF